MASKKKLNKAQKAKQKFRASSKWKDFRHWKNVEQCGLDPITGSKLPKGAHLHHKNLNANDYEDISDESMFILLQPTTHKWIHWGLVQIKKLHSMEILERYMAELKREAVLNGYIEPDD